MFRGSIYLFAAAFTLAGASAHAEGVSFSGKNITMIVGSAPGGSSDLSARLFVPFFMRYLPGNPVMVIQNMPGGHNVISMNYIAQQAKRDGTYIVAASGSEVDPLNYRVPQSHYDPAKLEIIGGINLGGSQMIVRNDALARMKDKSQPPIVMGSIAGYPHLGMQTAAWGIKYLDWNMRWVTGYGNNNDLGLAVERGEIDATSLSDSTFTQLSQLLDKGKYTLVSQTGTGGGKMPSGVASLKATPLFDKLMDGKVKDPVALEAYEYWRDLSYVFKWFALPPETPKPILDAYRAAFVKIVADPDFISKSETVAPGVTPYPVEDLIANVNEVAAVHPAALDYVTQLLREQGLNVEELRKEEKAAEKKSKDE
jgi:tripartite-type tricarboxylate transporter receptor subunit TctC